MAEVQSKAFRRYNSDPVQIPDSLIVFNISGIERRVRFKEDHLARHVGHRPVFNPTRYDHERVGCKNDRGLITQFDAQSPCPQERQFVLGRVPMPNEFAFNSGVPDLHVVDNTGDPRSPCFAKRGERLFQIDLR